MTGRYSECRVPYRCDLAEELSSAVGDAMQGWESVFRRTESVASGKRESRLHLVLNFLRIERFADDSLIAVILQEDYEPIAAAVSCHFRSRTFGKINVCATTPG